METTRWQDLIVYDTEGHSQGTLAEMVDSAPANLDDATFGADGSIETWLGWFIAAPDEDHNDQTPEGPVDWSGFQDALAIPRGLA